MEPGTAAILVLSAITGISGYGAMKLNAKRGASIDEEVKKAIGDANAIIKATEDAKEIAEQEVQKLKEELTALKQAEKQLTSDKERLSESLKSASELEKTYRGLSTEVFKEAIQDFMKKDEIKKLGDLKNVFDPLLSRYSLSRGTAESLYTKMKNTVGKDAMLPKPEFDALLLKSLKEGPSLLEKRRADKEAAKLKAVAVADARKKLAADKAKEIQDKQDEEEAKLKEEAMVIATSEDQQPVEPTEDKPKKDERTLQKIVDEALEAAKEGPLTSNTTYQSIKKPFLSGLNSVAVGVHKTGKLLRTPLTAYENRQAKIKTAIEEDDKVGGANDTFDTDVYYRLYHPMNGDRPRKVLAHIFQKTLDDKELATNMLPVFDAFMYWRKTVLNFSLLYKPELVAAAMNLFKSVNKVNPVFQNKELKKAIEGDKQKIEAKDDTIVQNPMRTATTGGMRKKKLRTRRGVKQNVRRTRRSQNRPNRTDTYSSRRTEVDASGDELGL